MRKLLFCLLLYIFSFSCFGQDLQPVPGLPTKEIYDLKIDHKGYLWVAHDLGISRFDGVNFTSYSNELQSSLSMTDIAEDNEGRIWCHNFNGQVFYVENERLKLFQAYNYKVERQFPRLAFCNNEILITSESGIYAVNGKTLQTKFYSFDGTYENLIVTISIIGNKAVVYNKHSWFVYEAGSGLKKINQIPVMEKEISAGVEYLQPGTLKDTFYMICNPTGVLKKLILKDDEVKVVESISFNEFINSTTISRNQLWVHTRSFSKNMASNERIDDLNFTDIAEDMEGNTWYSSLKDGLMIQNMKHEWELDKELLQGGDFIRCIKKEGDNFFVGTQRGELLLRNPTLSKNIWRYKFPKGNGAVEYITELDNKNLIIATSITSYIVDYKSNSVQTIKSVNTFKKVDFTNDAVLYAAPNALFIQPKEGFNLEWAKKWGNRFPYLPFYMKDNIMQIIYRQRCRSVIYDRKRDIILGIFKSGLYELGRKALVPYLFNKKQVLASSLDYNNGKLFIGTFNNGLLIDSIGNVKNITTNDLLHSNSIIRTKLVNNHLWLFENNSMQVLDCNSDKIINNLQLPEELGGDAIDVEESNGYAFITSVQGTYKIKFKENASKTLKTYIDYVTINNRDTVTTNNVTLEYYKNDLQFYFSAPEYTNAKAISFNYRLIGSGDGGWHTTKPYERLLRFVSIEPGNYKLEIYASYPNRPITGKSAFFQFTIKKPWWEQWWFYLLVFLSVIGATYIIYRYRIMQLVKMENMRRKISSDLHDDIGATLSSINIYTELARKEKDGNLYINMIETHSTEVIQKLDDLVWSINPNNDSLEQLINRMYSFAEPLLQASAIQCSFKNNEGIYKVHLDIDTKRNIFLVFKELINNVAKHSKANQCFIKIEGDYKMLYLEVKDNGIGFNKEVKKERNGLRNLMERVAQMNGSMEIDSGLNKGTTVEISVPI